MVPGPGQAWIPEPPERAVWFHTRRTEESRCVTLEAFRLESPHRWRPTSSSTRTSG